MNFREYLEERVKEVENDEEKILAIYAISEEMVFKYHQNCFADFHDDFVIFYDKGTKVNFMVKYDKISVIQTINKEVMVNELKEKFSKIGELMG